MAKPSFSELQKTQADVLQSLADIKDIKAIDALMSKLKKVKEDLGKYEEERAATVAEISAAIVDNEVKFTELTEAARQVLEVVTKAAKPAKKTGGTATTQKKAGEVLIKVKASAGRPAEYNKGQDIPQYVPRTFKALYEANKDTFDAKLAESFTEAGKAYFATPEGAAELKALVEFVKTKKAQTSDKKK